MKESLHLHVLHSMVYNYDRIFFLYYQHDDNIILYKYLSLNLSSETNAAGVKLKFITSKFGGSGRPRPPEPRSPAAAIVSSISRTSISRGSVSGICGSALVFLRRSSCVDEHAALISNSQPFVFRPQNSRGSFSDGNLLCYPDMYFDL